MRFGSAAICAIFLGLSTASPAAATTVVYSIRGEGEASSQSILREFVGGDVVDTITNVTLGSGRFTSTYQIDIANLPSNSADSNSNSLFESRNGSPKFLTSRTSATIAGQSFGLVTDGLNYVSIGDGIDFIGADILIGTGPLHGGGPLFTYYDSGAVKTSTYLSEYNQFYAFGAGGSFIVDGLSLPGFNQGGFQQIAFQEIIESYADRGSLTSFEVRNRTFGGAGSVTISTLSAALPEPQNWALMLVGFGLVGAAVRHREQKGLTPPATAA
jgi:hypothetical protein